MAGSGGSKRKGAEKSVLVGVIKDRRDLSSLLAQKWYRIPVKRAPRRRFTHLAFYQPSGFGRRGMAIRYYARVVSQRTVQRKDVLPYERKHPRAEDRYFLFRVDDIKKLPRPIKNVTPRRISFGFTTLERLLKSENILQLYDVAPTEELLGQALKRAGTRVRPQQYIRSGQKRFYVDFAVFCRRGALAIECDNRKAHSGLRKRRKDKTRDAALRREGWTVLHFSEKAIVSDPKGCMLRVKKAIRKLGGLARHSSRGRVRFGIR